MIVDHIWGGWAWSWWKVGGGGGKSVDVVVNGWR